MTVACTRTKLMFQCLDGRQVVGRFDGRRDYLRHRARSVAISGATDSDSGSAHRVLRRPTGFGSDRTLRRGIEQATGSGPVPGLRGSQRPRRVVPGSPPGSVMRPGRPDRGVSTRGVGSRQPLAGKSTLDRLELTPLEGPEPNYKKIVADPAGMQTRSNAVTTFSTGCYPSVCRSQDQAKVRIPRAAIPITIPATP